MINIKLVVILLAAVAGVFLVGCECNKDQFPSLYLNASGADMRETLADCKIAWDVVSQTWRGDIRDEGAALGNHVNGADMRETLADGKAAWDIVSQTWRGDIRDEGAALNGNVSGNDWRTNVAGSCGSP